MGRDLTQTRVASEMIYEGTVLKLHKDRVALSDGRQFDRLVLEHPGAVAIVPVTADGDVLLVRQYRYAAGEALLEVVAGTVEPGEDPAATAARELQEEAGVKAGRLVKLCEFFTAPGFCQEKMHLFVADDLSESRLPGDDDEEIDVVRMPLTEAVAMAQRGELRDAKTIVALCLAASRK